MSFDKREWLVESSLKPGKTWIPFKAGRSWEFCDVLLKDGTKIGPCFQRPSDLIDITKEEETVIAFKDVSQTCYYKSVEPKDSDESEDEEDGEPED
jgi:hypothetical protein